MYRYKFIRNHNEYINGDEVDLDKDLGNYLERVGAVIKLKVEIPPAPKKMPSPRKTKD